MPETTLDRLNSAERNAARLHRHNDDETYAELIADIKAVREAVEGSRPNLYDALAPGDWDEIAKGLSALAKDAPLLKDMAKWRDLSADLTAALAAQREKTDDPRRTSSD